MVDMQLILYSLIGAGILALIALIGSNMSTIMDFFSGEWARSMEHAREQKAARERLYGYASVNHSQNVMSRDNGRPTQTDKTDEQTDRASEADRWVARMRVDKTKAALIDLLVYSGWDTSQVRSVLKGDNGALGTEVEAAQRRLGIAPPAPYVTPIVGRATSAQFETDRDFPYQSPAT